jgi:hypothetical protein
MRVLLFSLGFEMWRVKNLNFFPCLSADQLHPDEGEEQQQAGDDQHLLQSINFQILPSINTGSWSVPQRVGEEEQQAGDDQHLLHSISLHFL